jgi:thiamine-phosphate pyrophosphorylase
MAAKDKQPDQPQLYLITPAEFELDVFPNLLASVLDAHSIACVRMAMASQDEQRLSKAADALREVTHARDVALLIEDHIPLVERLGLDGVHLSDGAHQVRYARKELLWPCTRKHIGRRQLCRNRSVRVVVRSHRSTGSC